MSERQKAKMRAFLFGMGSVLDVSGRSVMVLPAESEADRIAHDFRRVGERFAVASEELKPEFEAEIARQLPLKLNA